MCMCGNVPMNGYEEEGEDVCVCMCVLSIWLLCCGNDEHVVSPLIL